MRRFLYVFFLVIAVNYGCEEISKVEQEIEKINVDVNISRFDRELANATVDSISALKEKYPYLYPEQIPDSIWVAKLTDTLQVAIIKEIEATFGDFKQQEAELEDFYKHVKYYFPKENTQKVVTVVSDVDYNYPVILTNELLLLGLVNYLGEDHRFYAGFSDYIAAGLDKKYLLSDVASAFASKYVKYPNIDRTFLAQMVYYGKILYLKDKLIPFNTDAQKIKYTQEDLDWAYANQEQIWRHFVENEHLFNTDKELSRRFLDPAPFSKFQLELDSESPGRLGRFVGWQIVRAYMEKNNTTIEQLLTLPAEQIYKKSNYKPKR